ncbi:EpsG family protein [Alkalicoccus daliensis]|uniref:EpsG family protein n=1 Tax=Alkalicoccus daliensis TaxID=745820 RepID=A0A1G9ZKJ7_9BACI|nr:EpsG family protein [Alkalicoccus daliensis]SDN21800.1 EpsG family protein [Alkalicoccus daliensis]
MEMLWLNLGAVFSFAFTARYFSVPVIQDLSFPPKAKPNAYLALLALSVMVAVAGLRRGIGDTYVYRDIFDETVWSLNLALEAEEPGFAVLQWLLQHISSDGQILIFTASLITLTLITAVLYKYSRLFELSLYVFITSGMFLVSMNGMRQYLAASIVFAGASFLFKGKLIPYVLTVLLASTFHQSALIMLPVYFIVRREAWTKSTMALVFAGTVFAFGYDQFSHIIFGAISETKYGSYSEFDEGGANIIRVMVTAAPVMLAYFGRHKLKEIFPESHIVVNLSLMGFIFMMVSTQQWIFARMAIYFDLFSLILISWVVKVFAEKDQRFIYYVIVVLYLFYFFYEYSVTLNINYQSEYLPFFREEEGT